MKPLKLLLSAYACGPGRGSDPGIGWHIAKELAKHHHVWVLTREDNRAGIEAELVRHPDPNLHIVYYDIPYWMRWWKQGLRGVQLHYYLWQVGIYVAAQTLHREIGFDLVHHVTYVKHWGPSFLALLPVPFVWGPIGGGESAPKPFWHDLSLRGKVYELLRDVARSLGERDPFVRLTARRSAIALAATTETRDRLAAMGCKQIEIFGVAGIPKSDFATLSALSPVPQATFRVISIGRLLHWKGFHLGLRAFAQLDIPDAEYWVVGDGPDKAALIALAQELGIGDRVRFWGLLPREQTLQKLEACHALVHPSLHDSGGWVCLEAMAASRPVICLDLGGPATQVTEATGFKVPAPDPEQAVKHLAEAMSHLAHNAELGIRMGKAGQQRVQTVFDWEVRVHRFKQFYADVLSAAETQALTQEIDSHAYPKRT
ncbi:MAG: glycosyltransferase family 4 protein [Lyngbya sp. HA4199-MV5]|jgi:glycosyltransferase involved in cell wall biosynthesis|nr:glycosyltransferase family 4 protein [Lyngbya sp. HA4199-MV5]